MRGVQNTRQQNCVVGSTDTASKKTITLLHLSKGKPFFFYACVIPFSRYGHLGVFCKFNSFLFIYFFFFLFLILNFFIYLFVPYKFLENGSNIFHHYLCSDFLGEKRLIKNIFLIIVIFLDNKYIKTLLNSNKILSENFKTISDIKLEIIG